MKLTIITCTYNSEGYLQECIDSVVNQNLDENTYEHIFVDALSTDKTRHIIEKYMKKYNNVKLIERKPKWVYNAMNEWIKQAKWEYIMCLNSDDYLENDILSWYLNFIEDTKKKDLYYWKLRVVKNGKNICESNMRILFIKKILFKIFWTNCLIFHPTVIWKTRVFLELWLFNENYKIASDYEMRIKFMKKKKTMCYYPTIVSNFRVHWWSLSNSQNWENEELKIKKNYLSSISYYISISIDKIIKHLM